MAVPIEAIQVGRVFEFKSGPRLVVSVSPPLGNGFQVGWEYADGVRRNGKIGGSQWVHYFRGEAKRELIAEADGPAPRTLLTSRVVVARPEPVTVTLQTKCPAKWAFVDMETGEVWEHDGEAFARVDPADVLKMAEALKSSARM